jgi:enamine deaminase RidA (YjgF/YER057c/UK114 family)
MSGDSSPKSERTVVGTIDSGDVYASTVASAAGYVFFGGTAIDESGRLAANATPPEPYAGSAAAQAEAQGRHLFQMFDQMLPKVGSSVADIVQVEQYVKLKVHADAYFRVATSKDYLGKAVPVAATAQVGSYVPSEAAVAVTGLAIVPDADSGLLKSEPEDPSGAASANRKFSELIFAGPYIFTTIFPSDRKSGLPEAARTPNWIWSGSEIGAEMKWGLEELRGRLANVGASLNDIVDYTVFLTDAGDLYEFDLAMKAAVGADAPSRTVIPSRGYALPRREGAFGHEQGAPRMEVQFRIRRPEAEIDKQIVDGPGAGFGYQSAAVRLGPLVWISSQVASPQHRGNAAAEIDDILAKIAETCANAGTSLADLLRIRVLLTNASDAAAFSAALRRAVPQDPPSVCIAVVPSALPVADATVAIDAVAFAPS